MGKINTLEMLRALAALLVVLFHAQEIFERQAGVIPFGGLLGTGYRGVDLFFVLSGFIIMYVHYDDLGQINRLPNYVMNRLFRIYPAVWVMSFAALLLYSMGFGEPGKAAKLAPGAVAASVLLLPQQIVPLVNVTWTLTYELFFYAVFAIIIWNQRIGLGVFLIWQSLIVLALFSNAGLDFENYYLRSLCLDFGIGMACGWWIRRSRPLTSLTVNYVLLLLGAAAFVLGMALGSASSAGVFCGLGSGAIIVALVRIEQSGKVRVPTSVVMIGQASYSIYLVHFSCIAMLAALLPHLGIRLTNLTCVACVVISVAAGMMFDRVVDQPIQRSLRRWKSRLLGVAGARAHPRKVAGFQA